MYYKENRSIFFDVIKNGQIFPLNVIHFPFDRRFLFSREMGTLEHARRYACKNLINLDCQGSIRFDIFQVAYK